MKKVKTKTRKAASAAPVCKQCGECCTWWVSYEWPPDAQLLARWKVGGAKVFRVRFGRKSGVALYLPYRCPQLTTKNRCKLHGQHKPQFCKEYPRKGLKYIMPDGCVFAGTRRGWTRMADHKTI